MKTSYKKNRPFDFKLINLVEPHPVLYQRQMGLSTYEAMKAKNLIWEQIAAEMVVPVDFCIMRWGNLRGQFTKELRHCRELCPKEGVIRGSSWPYLERLRFLESTVQFNKPKKERVPKRKRKAKRTSDGVKKQIVEEIVENTIDDDAEDTVEIIDICNDEFSIASDEMIEEHIFNTSTEEITEAEFEDESYTVIEPLTLMAAPPMQLSTVPTKQLSSAPPKQPLTALQKQPSTENEHIKNLQKIETLLTTIDSDQKDRVEKRILTFLCKCQLRALHNQGIDDIVI